MRLNLGLITGLLLALGVSVSDTLGGENVLYKKPRYSFSNGFTEIEKQKIAHAVNIVEEKYNLPNSVFFVSHTNLVEVDGGSLVAKSPGLVKDFRSLIPSNCSYSRHLEDNLILVNPKHEFLFKKDGVGNYLVAPGRDIWSRLITHEIGHIFFHHLDPKEREFITVKFKRIDENLPRKLGVFSFFVGFPSYYSLEKRIHSSEVYAEIGAYRFMGQTYQDWDRGFNDKNEAVGWTLHRFRKKIGF